MSKKLMIVSIVVILMASVSLFAGKRDDMWRKAITEKDPNLKYQYLQEYEAEFSNKKDKNVKYLYINLTITAYQLKKFDDAISYGEKALGVEAIEPNNKIQMLFYLANCYRVTKKDIEKAYHYAEQTVDMAKNSISEFEKSEQSEESKQKYINTFKTFYLAPSYRIQGLILSEKAKSDSQVLNQALEKFFDAYKTDKSENSTKGVFGTAVQCYRKKVHTSEAITALEGVLNEDKPNYNSVYLLANLYIRKKENDKAVVYLEQAYKLKRQAKIARKIAQMTHKKDIDKGLRYFAESFLLQDSDKTSDAYKYLENLWFNKKAAKLPAPEKEKGFNALLNEARARLGMEQVAAPAQPQEPAAAEEGAETEETTE